jgi:hypothetical protein
MKKLFSLVMVLAVLGAALWFNVGQASAVSYPTYSASRFVSGKGIVFVFDLNGSNLKAPNLKNATLYVGSNSYPLACTVNKEEGTIVCVVRGGLTEFAGQHGTIFLAGKLYSVIIPDIWEIPTVSTPDPCDTIGVRGGNAACDRPQ